MQLAKILVVLGLCALHARLGAAQADWQSGTLAELGFGSNGQPGPGACGYGVFPSSSPFGVSASLDPATSPFVLTGSSMSGCGICLEVACAAGAAAGCSSGTAIVTVTDFCEGCGPNTVYVSPNTFSSLVSDNVGEVAGRFRRVPCNPSSGIVVHVDSYRPTQGGWIRLLLLGVAGSGVISSVEIKGSSQPDSAWKPMMHTFGASWEASVLPPPPLDLRISSGGQQVVAKGAITQAGVTGNFPTSVQFNNAALGTPAPATPQPAASATPSPTTTLLMAAGGAAAVPPNVTPLAAAASPLPTVQASPAVLAPSPTTPSPAAQLAAPQPEVPFGSAVNPLNTFMSATATEPLTASLSPSPLPTSPSPSPFLPLQPSPSPSSAALPLALPALPAAAAPTPEADATAVDLLTNQTAPAVRPPFGALAPAVAEAPAMEPAPEAEPYNVTTKGTYDCASCVPCDQRQGEPIGLQPVHLDFASIPGLPMLPSAPEQPGPAATAGVVAATATGPGNCSTLLQLLEEIAEVSQWLELMRRVGLEMLLNDPKARTTLLVPADGALTATINACPLRNETLLSDLLVNAPELANPLVGYHVLRGQWPSYTLQPGTSLNSSDTIDKVNFLQIQVGPGHQFRGIGSNANILEGDIVACGPSIIHIVDTVLLPFQFNQKAIDAISGTQVPHAAQQPSPVTSSQGPPAGTGSRRKLLW